eukprot:366000-Chlamydomonas_euryale.AAC.73
MSKGRARRGPGQQVGLHAGGTGWSFRLVVHIVQAVYVVQVVQDTAGSCTCDTAGSCTCATMTLLIAAHATLRHRW